MSTAPALAKQEATVSEKFIARVEKQFVAEMGTPLSWTPLQKALAQHLFIKIDSALRDLELKRQGNSYKKDDPPITWENVNMHKLAMDGVHRVNLQLDALVPNHIHVIPYLNGRTKQYDVDLRIGYMGSDHVRRKFAIDPPIDIRYQLVHETDTFAYGTEAGVAWVKFEQSNPFSPGEVIGGFGYISYDDPRKNRVVIVEYREFEKAMNAAQGTEFWGGDKEEWKTVGERRQKVVVKGPDGKPIFDEKFRKEMQFKTVVIRVTSKIALDTSKINGGSWDAIIASEMDAAESAINEEIDRKANGEVIHLAPAALEQGLTTVPAVAPAEAAPVAAAQEPATKAKAEPKQAPQPSLDNAQEGPQGEDPY